MSSLPLILTSLAVTSLVWTRSSADSGSFPGIVAQAGRCPSEAEDIWSYRGSNGPDHWGEGFPQCNGARQSPIAIDTRTVLADENLEKLRFYLYEYPTVNAIIQNNGRTIQVLPDHPHARKIILNGTEYGLFEIHFHWGSARNRGSEHVIDGVQYAMEMHLVHRTNDEEYAVVSLFFQQGAGINAELQHIVNELPKVMYRNGNIVSRWRINLMNLIPESPASFFYYNGSLTTPDCAENVSWILLKTPVLIGNTQIREFRKLFSAKQDEAEASCKITGNIRPLQHLHGRRVYSSK